MSAGYAGPPAMKDLRQWVCWRAEQRDGKPTKVPYSPVTVSRARSDEPATWTTLARAREAAQRGDYEGVGFVFTSSDPFCGVDLDSCVDPATGSVELWAAEIVEDLDSYTEFSPSGTGLHVIVRADLPPGGNRKGRVEMYDRGRFFTVTGHRLPDAPNGVHERQEQIRALHASLFPAHTPSPNGGTAPDNYLEDTEVLRRATSAANGERFAKLWAGDTSGYDSDSEADLALCSMLAFWTGPDQARIASLFARSGLARKKWDREDYRRRTISRALAGAEFYESHNGDCRGSEIVSLPTGPPEAAPFPVGAMPAPCRTLIEEATAALGCAPELVALPMLAALSSAIGTSRVVEVKGGWREWAALFVAVVASPGAMKTPAAKVAKKPAFERQRSLGRAYVEEKDEWRQETREWEVEKREAQKAGEPAPEEPEAPAMGRCVASDTTVEALVAILEDNPRGLLIHRDELAGWVRSMDQYKGGKGSDRQHWLNLWSTDEVIVDRKSRQGEPVILARPFVSLFGGIQPSMLGELGAGTEDGLMDRFLFAYPAPRHVRFTEDEVSEDAEEEYADLYRKLADLTLATDEHGDPNPRPLMLTRKARDLFASAVDSLGAEVLEPGFPVRLEGVWSKMRGYLARLSLVLAVCRCATTRVMEDRVEHGDVEAAWRLLHYFRAHARRVYAELSDPDPLDLLAADLRDFVGQAGGGWEGSAAELHRLLDERQTPSLPDRPAELAKAVLRIGERSSTLQARQGWRKSGGHDGTSRRVLKLTLAQMVATNGVVAVVADGLGVYGDNSDNSDFLQSAEKSEAVPAIPDGSSTATSDDTRKRFTL